MPAAGGLPLAATPWGFFVFRETWTASLFARHWCVLWLAHRKPEGNRSRHQPLTKNLLFLVGHFEKLRTRTQQTLGASQHEEPGRIQRVMKDRYYPFLQWLTQVNHHIAATYQIHAGEGRIVEDILRGKNTEIADVLLDLIAAVRLIKEAPQACRRDIRFDILLIYSGPGALDGALAQVGAKDLDGNIGSLITQKLYDGDRMGVSSSPVEHPGTQMRIGPDPEVLACKMGG